MSGTNGNGQSMDEVLESIRRIVANGRPEPEPAPFPPAAAEVPHVASVVDEVPAPAAPSLEATVRAMLEPQLKAWLDAHLPEIVERVTRAEIERLTRR